MPDGLKLETSEKILRFLREVAIPSAITDKLGVRVVSTVTTACRVLLDYESLRALEQRVSELEAIKETRTN